MFIAVPESIIELMNSRALYSTRCNALIEDVEGSGVFHALAARAKVQTTLRVARKTHSMMGLVTPSGASKGEVLMRVPASVAIVLDYNTGLRVPASARWPR